MSKTDKNWNLVADSRRNRGPENRFSKARIRIQESRNRFLECRNRFSEPGVDSYNLECLNFASKKSTRSSGTANAYASSRLLAAIQLENNLEDIDLIAVNQIETLPVTVNELACRTYVIGCLIQGLKNGRKINSEDRFRIHQIGFSLQQNCLMH